MKKLAITCSMVSACDEAKYLGKDAQWRDIGHLVTLDKAKTFTSEASAEAFISQLEGAGFTSFRVAKLN